MTLLNSYSNCSFVGVAALVFPDATVASVSIAVNLTWDMVASLPKVVDMNLSSEDYSNKAYTVRLNYYEDLHDLKDC